MDRIADGHKRVPAALIMHGFEAVKLGKPASNLRPRPQAAIVRRPFEPVSQRRKRIRRKDGGVRPIAGPPVAKAVRPMLVVAFNEKPDPA